MPVLGAARDLDAEELAVGAPRHVALGHVEEVLLAHLLARRDGDEVHVRGRVALLGAPEREDLGASEAGKEGLASVQKEGERERMEGGERERRSCWRPA